MRYTLYFARLESRYRMLREKLPIALVKSEAGQTRIFQTVPLLYILRYTIPWTLDPAATH